MVTPPISIGKAVASIVTRRMDARSVSAKSLAAETGIALTTLNRRLKGHSSFTLNELDAIAAALSTTARKVLQDAERARTAA